MQDTTSLERPASAEYIHGKGNRHRSRHDEFVRGHHGRGQAPRDRKQRGRSYDPLDRCLHQGQRGGGRPVRQAAGRDQPAEHVVRREAPDRSQVRRRSGAAGHQHGPVQDRQGRQRRRLGRGAGQEDGPAGSFGPRPDEDEENGRGLSGRGGHRGRHHRARLFQRLAAPGDQGRRAHSGPDRQANHQRADRGRAGLRAGQAGQRSQDRRVRPGRRYFRRLDHRDRGSRRRAAVRSALDQRRYLPRRRGLRPQDHQFPGRGVPEGVGCRRASRPPGDAAPEGSGGKSEDRAVLQPADRYQSAVHHGGCLGA